MSSEFSMAQKKSLSVFVDFTWDKKENLELIESADVTFQYYLKSVPKPSFRQLHTSKKFSCTGIATLN